jgi:hypothetical protein
VNPFRRFTLTKVVPEVPWPISRLPPESAKVGAETVKVRAVDVVWLPDFPVTVALYCPRLAELLAVKVTVLFPVVGFGEKDAVTPLGRPDAERVTLPVNPFRAVTLTKVVPEVPWPMLVLPAESVKFGTKTARGRITGTVWFPDLPVIVTLYCPRLAELLAVKVTVLLPVVGFGEKDAVTPLGRPEAERVTLPVNPLSWFTLT